MQIITLYKITGHGGTVSVGPVVPEQGTEYETLTRLVADDGKTLTDGTTTTGVVDTYNPEAWTEIEDETQEITAEEALDIIRGAEE